MYVFDSLALNDANLLRHDIELLADLGAELDQCVAVVCADSFSVTYPGAGEPSLQACHTVADRSMAANPEYTATCAGDVELADILEDEKSVSSIHTAAPTRIFAND
jgi:hypothetical protein